MVFQVKLQRNHIFTEEKREREITGRVIYNVAQALHSEKKETSVTASLTITVGRYQLYATTFASHTRPIRNLRESFEPLP